MMVCTVLQLRRSAEMAFRPSPNERARDVYARVGDGKRALNYLALACVDTRILISFEKAE